MMKSILLVAAAATFASAQVIFGDDGSITCPADKPNGNFCAGDSLKTNIIIRCSAGKGQAGNCWDNLAGYPGSSVSALCYQSSPTAGDGACEKACVVHNEFGPFYPLPGCTTSTSSAIVGTGSSSYSNSTVTSTISPSSSTTALGATTTTITTTSYANGTVTIGSTTLSATSSPIISTSYASNGTATPVTISSTTTASATHTPISPPSATTSGPVEFTGAASSIQNWGAIAGAGMAIAYFL